MGNKMLDFINGKPAVFTGFDGELYIAIYFKAGRDPVGHLSIRNAAKRVISEPIMSEHQATSFYWNLDAVADD